MHEEGVVLATAHEEGDGRGGVCAGQGFEGADGAELGFGIEVGAENGAIEVGLIRLQIGEVSADDEVAFGRGGEGCSLGGSMEIGMGAVFEAHEACRAWEIARIIESGAGKGGESGLHQGGGLGDFTDEAALSEVGRGGGEQWPGKEGEHEPVEFHGEGWVAQGERGNGCGLAGGCLQRKRKTR